MTELKSAGKRIVRRAPLTVFLLICAALCYAQDNSAAARFSGFIGSEQPWLIPRTVYIGDPAMFVLPLPPSPRDYGDIVISSLDHDYSIEDIDIHRIVLEKRVSGNRLLIEFTAFATGRLELPLIEIDGESFSGLSVEISSLLDISREPQLFAAASTLAIPGTAAMLYGAMAGIVFLLLFSVWLFLRGRFLFAKLYEKWKRWNLFVYMKNTEKNLARLLLKGGNKREILDRLSQEFRAFLSVFTGNNCRAMTARELSGDAFLGKYFRRCDDLRFCGKETQTAEISALLADLRAFIAEAEKKEKAA